MEDKAKQRAMEHCCAKCVHDKLGCGVKIVSHGRDCIKCGNYIKGYHQAEKDVLDVIEKELTRRMLEDYNEGVEEDEIAQGCMASLIMFVRQMKEE